MQLNLDDLTVLDAAQSIRRRALQQALRQLVQLPGPDEPVDDGRARRPARLDVLQRRQHSAILVTARRGDGKTTFLTHLLGLVQQGRQAYAKELPDGFDGEIADLYSLGIIDPTLIESKQNIIVMMIDRIRDAVDRLAKAEPGRAGAHEEVRSALRHLASGLTLLDGIGTDDLYGRDWADPDYVLQQGLDRGRAADEFERSFYAFIAKACDYLRIHAFVIAIDDVDTAFDRGWPVLEALRKYLATDRLRVVLSGDLGLYNMLVRREQWRQVTPVFLEAERLLPRKYGQTVRLAQLIEELQDQYLVKVVPPDRRVELQPLDVLVADGDLVLRFDDSEWDPRTFIGFIGGELVRAILPPDRDAFASAILRLPLRSATRVLSGGAEMMRNATPTARREAFVVLRQVLSSVLLSRDVDVASLTDPDPRRVLYALANWLTAHGRWVSGASFTASTGEEDYDLVAIFVAAALVRTFTDRPYSMLEFALRICVVREKAERETLDEPALRRLLGHLWPTAGEGPIRFVSRLAAWESETMTASGEPSGHLLRLSGVRVPVQRIGGWDGAFQRLYGATYGRATTEYAQLDRERFAAVITGDDEAEKARLLAALPPPIRAFHERLASQDAAAYQDAHDGYYNFANSLVTLRSGLRSGASALLMLGACRLANDRPREDGVFSVLRLIATTAELSGLHPQRDGELGVGMGVENLLNEAELFRSYPTATMGTASAAGADSSGLDEVEDERPGEMPPQRGQPVRNRRQVFAAAVENWLRSGPSSEVAMSPQTISRVWTRFTYAFDAVRSDLDQGRSVYLGVLVHRSIIAFLHALGVEALRTVGRRIGPVAYRNPVASAQPFAVLLGLIYDDEGPSLLDVPEIAFFDHVFACPLWGWFLARRDGDLMEGRGPHVARIIDVYYSRINARREAWGGGEAGNAGSGIDDANFAVSYAHRAGSPVVTRFTGFYALLNTVPVLDGTSRGARPNSDLSDLIGTRPQRRRSIRTPTVAGSSGA